MLQSVVVCEVTAGLALLSDESVEATAAQAWADLSDVGDAEDIARAARITVREERSLPVGFDGLALPTLSLVLVRPSRSRGLWVLRVLHELAHCALRAESVHTHADVWRLTLALAWPLHRVRAGLPPLEIPPWALSLRAAVLEETRVISAA